MGVNNQGIAHLATKKGGMPACKNVRAHISTDEASFVNEPKQCKKCVGVYAKWIAIAKKKCGGLSNATLAAITEIEGKGVESVAGVTPAQARRELNRRTTEAGA